MGDTQALSFDRSCHFFCHSIYMKRNILILLVCLVTLIPSASANTVQNKNPRLVAQKLYQAWHLKNRRSALKVADKEAVDKLFGIRWRAMKFEGCSHRDEGGFECIYRDTRIDLTMAMIVDGGISAGGYNVASVSFSSE